MSLRTEVLLKNLPSQGQLTPQQVLTSLQECTSDISVFDDPHIDVKVFNVANDQRHQHAQRWGLLSGLSISVQKWTLLKSVRLHVNGRRITIHTELGDQRDDNGKPLHFMDSAHKRNLMNTLYGETSRKVVNIFKDDFYQSINVFSEHSDRLVLNMNWRGPDFFNEPLKVVRGENSELAGAEERYYDIWKMFNFIGSLLEVKGVNYRTVIHYGFRIEMIQAIRFLNGSEIVDGARFVSFDFNDKRLENPIRNASCTDCKGLGSSEEIVQFLDLVQEYGYVPISELDPNIISIPATNSICYVCNNGYEIIGVDANFDFYAAGCECNYGLPAPESGAEILGIKRPVKWFNEFFTRLVIAPTGVINPEGGTQQTLIVSFNPLKIVYRSPLQYSRILLPIIKEEWHNLKQWYEQHQVTVNEDAMSWTDIDDETSLCEMILPETKFWNVDNSMQLNRVTLFGTGRFQARKGVIVDISPETHADQIRIILRINCDGHKSNNLTIIPKPTKTEYTCTKKLLIKFADEIICHQTDSFLGISSPLPVQIVARPPIFYNGIRNRVLEMLTRTQTEAIAMAIETSFSVIQGPPGTGKSTTVAVLAMLLSMKEKSKLILCCPTNVACDVVSQKLMDWAEDVGAVVNVIRVHSVRRKFDNLNHVEPNEWQYDNLHQKLNEDEEIRALKTKYHLFPFGERREYELTSDQRTELQSSIVRVERKIISNYNIIVATLGCVSDNRLDPFKDEIGTIIVDEAGQALEPLLLNVMQFNPLRFVLVGDHSQLSPKSESTTSLFAGLERSCLERVSLINQSSNTRNKIPWTTLLEQHRMVPKLRQLISTVFYHGRLIDAEVINSRPLPEYWYDIVQLYPTLNNSPIVLRNHNCVETKSGLSYFNVAEVEDILEDVTKIMNIGVPANRIAICTMYESQREVIVNKLSETGGPFVDIECRNVDGYQGREKDIIFLSLVRSNDRNMLGFTTDSHRLNVAFSRARFGLFLYGNMRMLRNNKEQIIGRLFRSLTEITSGA